MVQGKNERDRSGGGPGTSGGPPAMKRGPWTPDEDELLRKHVAKFKAGGWDAVYGLWGLARSGNSCKLRWSNHLRPGLKKTSPAPGNGEGNNVNLNDQMVNKRAKMTTKPGERGDNTRQESSYSAGVSRE